MSSSSCCPTVRGEIKKARAGNYEIGSCIFEFIDNALDAGADRIRIDIRERCRTGLPHKFLISDNASNGIQEASLRSIFSWTYERERTIRDVGEYGTGFKTASVNLAEKLTVATTSHGKCFQAVADWQDMADEDRWDPKILEISNEYFQDFHPYRQGSTFILESLRNEMFSFSDKKTPVVVFLFKKLMEDVAYHYRYLLYENPTLHLTIKGIPETGGEICEIEVREHDMIRKGIDPFKCIMEDDPSHLLETTIAVYQDQIQCLRVFYENPKTKKWESIEYIDRRKNGNSILRSTEILPNVLESMSKIDTLVFRSIHLRDQETSSVCMSVYPTCTLDIVRKGRVMGRDLCLRAPRAEPLNGFVKHELWYHSYTLNALLGIQFNKQNHGVLRENDLRYTMEHLQQIHEREYLKYEKSRPSPLTTVFSQPSSFSPPPLQEKTEEPKSEPVVVPPPSTITTSRRHFTPSTKIEVLNQQECRDRVLDFILKDGILLMEYDHKNGQNSQNTRDNCQALSVISHSLKTRKPDVFRELEERHESRVRYLVDLLNCITRSRYFIESWISGSIKIRPTQQSLQAVQEGLFFV